jgi:hypothetical protein
MSNFNELLDASVDAGLAWARRHTKQPEQPAVVLESDYIKMYQTLKRIAAQRDLWMARTGIYLDTIRAFKGRTMDRDSVNDYLDKLAADRGVTLADPPR